MNTPPQQTELEHLFAPRWTLRAVLLAATVTLGIYLLLPGLEMLSAPPEKDLDLRKVDTSSIPPPPPPPAARQKQPRKSTPPPRPELDEMQRRLSPMQASMNLNMAMGSVGGDFSVNFGINTPDLEEQLRAMVFELSELDEAPRPLARLSPVYPAQARMRRVEGLVVLEFVVDPAGMPRGVEIVSAQPSTVFNAAAIRAIEHWRFSPGTKNGKPVACRVRQKVNFSLK